MKNNQYKALVKQGWSGEMQSGWGSIVLKNKLKTLKSSLKSWSIQYGDSHKNKVDQLKQQLHQFDSIAQVRTLGVDEVKAMKSTQQELWEVSLAHESILRQKSRIKLLKEGDSNIFKILIQRN